MTGQAEASLPPLGTFREYLRTIARMQFDPRLRRKLDPSDVVQETLTKAHEGWDGFQGQTEAELAAWLRGILKNCLRDEVRRYSRQKRDASLELSLDEQLAESSVRIEEWLAADELSPRSQALRHEELMRVAASLAQLPDEEREAVELTQMQQVKLAEAATILGCTPWAVSRLAARGLRKLRYEQGPGPAD